MPLIDAKGRLFGKINLLDLVVLLAIVAVGGRFGYKWYAGRNAAPVGVAKTIQVTVRLAEVRDFTINALQPGADIFDSKSNTYLGKVVDVRSEPAMIKGASGEWTSQTWKDYFITIEGEGRLSPNGVTLAGIEAKVGRGIDLKTAGWAGTGTMVIVPQQ